MYTQKYGFKISLDNRASTKQILLAQQEIHWPQASGPLLILTPATCKTILVFHLGLMKIVIYIYISTAQWRLHLHV